MDSYSDITINPIIENMFKGTEKLNNISLLEKIALNADKNLLHWTCPICFDEITMNGMKIACPYTCGHLCCFRCLDNECSVIKENNGIPYKKIRCSLCRARPNGNWIHYYKIKTTPLIYKGISLQICDAVF